MRSQRKIKRETRRVLVGKARNMTTEELRAVMPGLAQLKADLEAHGCQVVIDIDEVSVKTTEYGDEAQEN